MAFKKAPVGSRELFDAAGVLTCRGCSCPFRRASPEAPLAVECTSCRLVFCVRPVDGQAELCKAVRANLEATGGAHWCHCQVDRSVCGCQPCHKRRRRRQAAGVAVDAPAAKRVCSGPSASASASAAPMRVRAFAPATGARVMVPIRREASWAEAREKLRECLGLTSAVTLVTDVQGFAFAEVAALRDDDQVLVYSASSASADVGAAAGAAADMPMPAAMPIEIPEELSDSLEPVRSLEAAEMDKKVSLLDATADSEDFLADIVALLGRLEPDTELFDAPPTPPPLLRAALAALLRRRSVSQSCSLAVGSLGSQVAAVGAQQVMCC